MIFDGLDFQTRTIKLRPRQQETCLMCKSMIESKELSDETVVSALNSFDYISFCGVLNYNDKTVDINILNEETERVSCHKYKEILDDSQSKDDDHLLIDCRPQCQFKICALQNALSIEFFDKLL